MSTKIHIVFVSTVGLHQSLGDWRHKADRGCHILCVYIYYYCLWVFTTTLSIYSWCMHSWWFFEDIQLAENVDEAWRSETTFRTLWRCNLKIAKKMSQYAMPTRGASQSIHHECASEHRVHAPKHHVCTPKQHVGKILHANHTWFVFGFPHCSL